MDTLFFFCRRSDLVHRQDPKSHRPSSRIPRWPTKQILKMTSRVLPTWRNFSRAHREREITADFDGGLELQKVRLLHEDLLGRSAELLNLRLWQLRVLPRLQILHLQQTPYDIVQQGRIHLLPSPGSSTLPALFSKLLKNSRPLTVKEKRNLDKKNSSTDRRNLVLCSWDGLEEEGFGFVIGVSGAAQRC